MQMPVGDPHPSTLPGFRGTRDPERSVTRLRSGRKKNRVEFEDIQPQDISNPTEDNWERRHITQLPDGYWFCEYCGVGHPIVKEEVKYHIDHRTVETITWEPWFDSAVSKTEDVLNAKLLSRKRIPLQVPNGNYEYYLGDRCWRQVTGEVRIPLDHLLSMSPHITSSALHEMRQAGFVHCLMLTDSQRMGNLDLFGPSALIAGITPVVVTSTSVHSLSQDFSLPSEVEGPDLGWHMEWTGRRERLPIARLRDPLPMSLSYAAVAPDPWYAATHPCEVCVGRTKDPEGGGRACYCSQAN
ncbi:hypothetical protein GIB67_013753 [Kingdonia uniflora]|uniref:Uncharacterized protein n=1 Tax=Kingdonia uniflora TaxID=39325 RepID=A0A7J7NQF8_9MAGN|nr:hypothetical protein GIB67_013753 [Kingdonia uniflora]